MKWAYADPPYVGQARKHYAHDPQCAEVDHAALFDRLRHYDAWALSAGANLASLRVIVPLLPDDARIAAWVKPFASFKPGVDPAYTWELVAFKTARCWARDQATVRDHLAENITLRKGLCGAKPRAFCFWLFGLLGATPDDDFDDLYPGTGIVAACWHEYCTQPTQQRLFVQAG